MSQLRYLAGRNGAPTVTFIRPGRGIKKTRSQNQEEALKLLNMSLMTRKVSNRKI